MVAPRVLPDEPRTSLAAYVDAGGGRAAELARRVEAAALIDAVDASGLRGRGGAGFPSGRKWRTVAAMAGAGLSPTVVVNAAEGEPGTFKDRSILRRNPFAVIEGGIVAARAVGAGKVVIALKSSFGTEAQILEAALREVHASGWGEGLELVTFRGPSEYLFGEETGLLEVLDGRPPFPRIAPPYRHGLDEVSDGSGQPGDTVMATQDGTVAPPTLVSNTETFANVPGIVADGPEWFRSVGTDGSPGTVVVTISGATRRHGVAEVPMGIPLATVIETVGGGGIGSAHFLAALSGVANPLLPVARFDTPLTFEDMLAAGSGLGAAGFIVFDDTVDVAAVAAGVSRFLAVESCGQCTPCKGDGRAIAEHLLRVCASDADDYVLGEIASRLTTVAEEARCYLASQHQQVITSMLDLFPASFRGHMDPAAPAVEPVLIAPIVDIVDGRAVLDETQLAKRYDWTYRQPGEDDGDSGQTPVEVLTRAGSPRPT